MIKMASLINLQVLLESTDKNPKPDTGVICRECGPQGLSDEQYKRQMMAADSLWKCPICGDEAIWDDERYERNMDESVIVESEDLSDRRKLEIVRDMEEDIRQMKMCKGKLLDDTYFEMMGLYIDRANQLLRDYKSKNKVK